MRSLICLTLAALLSGCLPIGVRGTSMPLRDVDVGERPIVAALVGANSFARSATMTAAAE